MKPWLYGVQNLDAPRWVRVTGGSGEKTAIGRDHHKEAFTVWMAGGGTKPGHVHGRTDDLGYGIADSPCMFMTSTTLLHLLGMDHERLTYRFQGRKFRLTDVHGNVVKNVIA